MRAVFFKLKANRYLQRAKQVARNQYSLNLLRKSIAALKENALKQTFLRLNVAEVEKTRKKKFFSLWLAEFDKAQKEQGAEVVMKFSMLHQVVHAWKKHTTDAKKARMFRALNYEAQLLRHSFDLLTGNNVVN